VSYTLTQAKDLVINQGYAIKNDDSVEKLNEVFSYIKNNTTNFKKLYTYHNIYYWTDEWHGNSIKLSEIEIPKQITIEMVIELRNQYPNNLDFGDAFDKLLNN